MESNWRWGAWLRGWSWPGIRLCARFLANPNFIMAVGPRDGFGVPVFVGTKFGSEDWEYNLQFVYYEPTYGFPYGEEVEPD